MTNLKVGDVRETGDEVRHLNVAGVSWIKHHPFCINRPPRKGEWEPIQLLGHKILASDLMVAEFRRP